MKWLINYWTNTCKLKIDTQCGSLEQCMTLVKINSCKGLIVSLMLENKKFSWGLIFFNFLSLLWKVSQVAVYYTTH